MHSIRLRGPWEYLVLTDAAGQPVEPPRSGRVNMPCDWAASLGAEFRGAVLFRRRFGRPTGIWPGDRLDLVFDGARSSATVALNDQALGVVAPVLPSVAGSNVTRFDVTSRLLDRNLLEVTVEHLSGDFAGGLAEVRLEITSKD